jgi:hypothetical protein
MRVECGIMPAVKSPYVVYVATCRETGKCYVGKSENFRSRKYQHLYAARHGSMLPFHVDIREYGEESITWEVIESTLAEYATLEGEMIFKKRARMYNGNFGRQKSVKEKERERILGQLERLAESYELSGDSKKAKATREEIAALTRSGFRRHSA